MKSILLVEPNKKIAEIIKKYFKPTRGVKVNIAHTAQDAIIAADKQKPDLVILELAIPMHNGFAFLHEFRSYSDWADVPVVVHSHLSRDEAAQSKSWKMLGASNYLYKPNTTLAKLKSTVMDELNL